MKVKTTRRKNICIWVDPFNSKKYFDYWFNVFKKI